MNIINVSKNEYLFYPGEAAENLYIVAHGELELSITINEKHLHMLKRYSNYTDIESSPKVSKKHNSIEDFEDYTFDIAKCFRLKRRA